MATKSLFPYASSLVILAATTAFAQPAPPPIASPLTPALQAPPPKEFGKKGGKKGKRERANVAIESLQGTVRQYLMNENGEVDGLLLADGTQLRFPPHMSADLTRTVRPGDAITAQGERQVASFTAFSITNAGTNQTIVESRPTEWSRPLPRALRGAQLQPLQVSGRVSALLRGRRGEVNGVVLDNGAIVRMPPDVGAQLATALQPGAAFNAKGYGTRNNFGTSLQATDIGAGGQPMVAIYGPATRAMAPPPPPPGALPPADAPPPPSPR